VSSGLPPVVKIVLDGLLVLSQDAIDAVVEAAAEPKPSVRSQLKALGWLVADAVGQTVPWSPEVALTVGKRLEKRVGIVRAAIAKLSDQTAIDAVMNAPCPCMLDELDLHCRLAPSASEACFPSIPSAAQSYCLLETNMGLNERAPPGLRTGAGYIPHPVTRPPAIITSDEDSKGRTRAECADARRHVPSWLAELVGMEASVYLEQAWAHSEMNPNRVLRLELDGFNPGEEARRLKWGLLFSREGNAMLEAFRFAALDLTYANEELAKDQAEVARLRERLDGSDEDD
jgi:hypothetical protein